MPITTICLLRGVNVGGNNQIKMDALRALCESLKLRGVKTYVQSGNAVFRAPDSAWPTLARRIEDAIEKNAGFRPDVILRTLPELRDVVARNPFAAREGVEPAKLLVTFLGEEPGAEAREKIRSLKAGPEELVLSGSELYIYFPNGQGQSKLSIAPLDRGAGKIKWTGRNWNTVTKLVELAASLET